MPVSDNELILKFICGDENAFMEIVSRYKDPITNYINTLLGDYERAVDLAQETFLRVYRNAERYKNTFQFSTWIYRIATNLAIDEIRWRKRYCRIFNPNINGKAYADLEELSVPDNRLSPDEALINEERRRIIMVAINSLPEKYRTVLVLKEVQDLSYERIAEVLGCSIGTVKSRLHRARDLLRKKLKGHVI